MVLRFGAFRSLVRPGFKESRAGAIINVDDNEIEGGNPNLDPTKATNIDISFEYYIDENTFLGAGVFYKKIEDAIKNINQIRNESLTKVAQDYDWKKLVGVYDSELEKMTL